MGILDDLLGAAVGSRPAGDASTGGGLSGMLGGVLGGALGGQSGQAGLGGLADAFNNAGLGDILKSWVGTGPNMPISATQVTQLLGSGTVGQIAAQLGMNAGQAGDLLNSAIGALAGKLFAQR